MIEVFFLDNSQGIFSSCPMDDWRCHPYIGSVESPSEAFYFKNSHSQFGGVLRRSNDL